MFPSLSERKPIDNMPKGAFIGSVQLEGTIVLETAIENSHVVDQVALLNAWEQLCPVSVEAALVAQPDLVNFANNHCLLFAAIRTPIKVVLPDSVELFKLSLPDHAAVTWADCPILSTAPSIVYESVPTDCAHTSPKPWFPFEEAEANIQESSSSEIRVPVCENRAVYEWRTIGIVYVTMSTIPHEVHVGLGLLPVFRRMGMGMKACAIAIQWAIETIHAHRVRARILASPGRWRTQRLLTALGFAHEGIQRRAIKDATGVWIDVVHMGIVDTDWVVRKGMCATPKNLWDELFDRHQREREELLRSEQRQDMNTVQWRSKSILVIPEELSEELSENDSQSPSPTSSPRAASYHSLLPNQELDRVTQGSQRRAPNREDSDAEDGAWFLSDAHSDDSSGESISRPLSAMSWIEEFLHLTM